MSNSWCWGEKIIITIKHKGLDYGPGLFLGAALPKKEHDSLAHKDSSPGTCVSGCDSQRFKIHLNVSSFLIGKCKVLGFCVRAASNPRNRVMVAGARAAQIMQLGTC